MRHALHLLNNILYRLIFYSYFYKNIYEIIFSMKIIYNITNSFILFITIYLTSTNEARFEVEVGAGINDSPPSLRSCNDPVRLSVLGALNNVLLPDKDNREL